jgi:hypothetical protein
MCVSPRLYLNLNLNSTMENIQDYIVFDIESGTYFAAANTVLINWNTLNEEQREIMIEGSDTERVLLAEEIGIEYK